MRKRLSHSTDKINSIINATGTTSCHKPPLNCSKYHRPASVLDCQCRKLVEGTAEKRMGFLKKVFAFFHITVFFFPRHISPAALIQLKLMHLLHINSFSVSSHKNAYVKSLVEWDIYEPRWCVCTLLFVHLHAFLSHCFKLKLSHAQLMQTMSVAHHVRPVLHFHIT